MMPYAYIPDHAYDALPNLSHVAAKVMVALAGFMPGNNSVGCFPSLAVIGERAGIARGKTITLAVKELVAKGVLVCEHRRRQTNIFKWAIQGKALSDPSKPLGPALSAPIDPIQGRALSAKVEQALSAPRKDTRKDTTAITSLLQPQHDENPQTRSAPPEAPKITPKKPKVAMANVGFVIPDIIRQTWATAFPGVDIDREAAKAFAWCQNNPRKAPKKDFGRFLHSWLGRAEPAGQSASSQGGGNLDNLADRVNAVAAKYGDDIARAYDAKAREKKSTAEADKWLAEAMKREGVA